jgi:hypothetical protein
MGLGKGRVFWEGKGLGKGRVCWKGIGLGKGRVFWEGKGLGKRRVCCNGIGLGKALATGPRIANTTITAATIPAFIMAWARVF